MSALQHDCSAASAQLECIKSAARRWLFVAVSSLIIAGLLSLMLIIGRMPPFSTWVTDPEFFKRCLVVHVDLALIVWFYAFSVALLILTSGQRASKLARNMFFVTSAGVLAMVASAWIPGSKPILANYIPVIDHPVFLGGLVLFALGLVITLFWGAVNGQFNARLSIPGLAIPETASYAFYAMALVVLIATVTFIISLFTTPLPSTGVLSPDAYFELLFWGGGHVLQVASVLTMLGVWIILLRRVIGRSPVSKRTAVLIFASLVAVQLLGPWLAAQGTSTALYHKGFTRMMQFGIFPAVLIFLGFCIHAIRLAVIQGRLTTKNFFQPAMIGFIASATLTLLGFGLGAMIRDSNTMIPAHYHASLGAITVSLMTVTFLLLEPLGLSIRNLRLRRLASMQPVLFGVGQTIFAIGFAIGGVHGLGRKTYAADQYVRTTGEIIGLSVMGFGGILAIIAGLLYLTILVSAYSHHFIDHFNYLRRISWNKKIQSSTLFKS